jgi:AcrR family transcriptional regulator
LPGGPLAFDLGTNLAAGQVFNELAPSDHGMGRLLEQSPAFTEHCRSGTIPTAMVAERIRSDIKADASAPPPARRGRPRDPGVDAAVLGAAMDLLAETGYARLTMEQVAARARVGKASLYLRWPNKVALVAEAIQNRTAVVPALPDSGNLHDDIRIFLSGLLRGKAAGARALAAVTGEIASNPDLRDAWRKGLSGTVNTSLRAIVERAVARGELPAATDVELLAALPLTLLQNWRLDHERGPDDAVVDRIVDQFFSPATRDDLRPGG